MTLLRTPEADTEGLADYPFAANYLGVGDSEQGAVRMHFVDHGPRSGPVMLLLHGEPAGLLFGRPTRGEAIEVAIDGERVAFIEIESARRRDVGFASES